MFKEDKQFFLYETIVNIRRKVLWHGIINWLDFSSKSNDLT